MLQSRHATFPPRLRAWITEWCDRQVLIKLAGSRGAPPSSSSTIVMHGIGKQAALAAVFELVLAKRVLEQLLAPR